MASKRAVVGWVVVSYFLIAGGVMMAAAALAMFGVASELATQGVLFVGALIGGVVAGRASPHKAVAEPAIAGLLVVGTLVIVFMIELRWATSWGDGGKRAIAAAVKMAVVSGLGGFVGGLIGRRSRRGSPASSALRWWGVSTLISLGTIFMIVIVVVGLGGDVGAEADSAASLVLLSLVLAALLGGFVSQAATPHKMFWTCGAGTFSVVILVSAFSIAQRDFDVSTVFGSAFLWGAGTLVGALGARGGWTLIASRIEPPSSIEVPEARLRS